MRIQKLLVVIFLFVSQFSNAQNSRYSQLWSAPLQFNPALSGRFDGQLRGGALASFQKSRSAETNHMSFFADAKFGNYRLQGDEVPVDLNRSDSNRKITREAKDETEGRKSNGYWSAGAHYYRHGDSDDPLHGDFVSGTVARHFYIKKNKFFGIGIQGTYARGTLDENRGLEYDGEIGAGAFRYKKRLNTSLPRRTSTKSYGDFNAGAYYGLITEQVSLELGLAMYHWFYPKSDIFGVDDETKLRHRVTAHTVLRIKLNDNWGLVSRNMYWGEGLYYLSTKFNGDSVHMEALWTGLEMYKTEPLRRVNLNFGLYSRSFRTVMPYVNLSLGLIANLRCSYEFPINPERFPAYNAKRTEVALILTHKKNTPTGTRFYKKFNYW